MAVTLRQVEAIPATYPAVTGLTGAAAALDPAMIWQRIESYIAYRWTTRAVVWTVEGPGEWEPPLTPATIATVEVWESPAWVLAFPVASPLGGYDLACNGPYRITGTVGSGTPPAAVIAAFKRLAGYIAGGRSTVNEPGAKSFAFSIGGDLRWDVTRDPAWMAQALINSGAADLLRPYRRAA